MAWNFRQNSKDIQSGWRYWIETQGQEHQWSKGQSLYSGYGKSEIRG